MNAELSERLLDYYIQTGDEAPTAALEDPDFMRQCLSAEAPFALLRKVLDHLEDPLNHRLVLELRGYERARALTALGEVEDAEALYKDVAETTEDINLRVKALSNLLNLLKGSGRHRERIELITELLRLDHPLAYSFVAIELSEINISFAVDCLVRALKEGNALAFIPVITSLGGSHMPIQNKINVMTEILSACEEGGVEINKEVDRYWASLSDKSRPNMNFASVFAATRNDIEVDMSGLSQEDANQRFANALLEMFTQ
jgi:tetratricopeptide (TPR) repeat protein